MGCFCLGIENEKQYNDKAKNYSSTSTKTTLAKIRSDLSS